MKAGMHMRGRLALALVLVTLSAGCVEVRNMQELKAALGYVPPSEALPPEAPVARAMAFPTVAKVGEPVLFTAAGSGDPEGRSIVYLWNFNDGTRADGAEVHHAFAAPGSYRVELTVSDPDGLWDVAAVEVRVLPDDLPPTVGIRVLDVRGAEAQRTTPGQPLVLRAVASDPENRPLAYAWDLGDGSVATEPEAKHAWTAPGRYTVALRVTDPAGLSNRTAVAVAVDHQATHTGAVAAGDPPASFDLPGGPGEALSATLAYDASFGANDLVLRVVDADGRVLAASALKPAPAAGAVNETVRLDAEDLRAAKPGAWKVVVERAAGVRVPFVVAVDLRY